MKLNTLQITPEFLQLVAELDEFKGRWEALSTIAPERLSVLRRVATIESVGSSTRIEGAKLSDREVEELLSGIEPKSFISRDEQEVIGYAEAMEFVFTSFESLALTENHIKQLHATLLKHSGKDERHRGEYKRLPNRVEAYDAQGKSLEVVFETASPFETQFRMQQLVVAARQALADRSHHPLFIIGAFIAVFLQIHPFQDGNGRLSRVLTTLLLLREGYRYVPYSSLESVIEQNKEGYYLALRRTQATLAREAPDWEPWLRFFFRALKKQKDILEVKIKGHPAAEGLPPEAIKILEHVRLQRRITTREATALLNAPRPTVKARLSNLVDRGLLIAYGKGRGAWYGPAN